MQIQKIRIISNNICYGLCPLPEDEVEQHLTISTTGRVWFSGYNYGGGSGEYQISRKQQFSIGKEKAVDILDLVLQYFSCDPLIMYVADNGDWELTITEIDAHEHWFKGSFCSDLVVGETDLTKYIRENIPVDDLFVFGGYEEDEDSSEEETNNADNIILFPNYDKLKKELEKLRTELSMLVLERDELQHVECKNIEMAYMLALGSLEYKTYEAQCAALRLKRKLELIQAKKNRQEKIILSQIEDTLDTEFAEYQEKLNEQMDKMNDAIKRSQCEFMSDEESRELKKLYRTIIKTLHPDLHPDSSKAQLGLFENAVAAYKNGDLGTLRIISEMVYEPVLPDTEQDAMAQLVQEKERLAKLLLNVKDSIAGIKSEYPYTVKDIVNDSEKTATRKAELEDILRQYEEVIVTYSTRIQKILR